MANTPPMAALDMNMGASNPPEVPEPSEITRATALASITTSSRFEGKAGIENVADRVIANTENAGHEVSDDAQTQRADRRPPEFVDGEFLELIFGPVKQLAEATAASPQITPRRNRKASARGISKSMAATANMGPPPSNCMCTAVARVLAMTSGINERDLNSNKRSSMARITPGNRCIESR